MRIALVHDWLTGMRGGERALEALCELFPSADLYTLLHVPGSVSRTIERHAPRTSFVQNLPRAARWYRYYLPLFPRAIERFDFTGYDLVISTSHCVAKSAITRPPTRHLCYCFTPMRYAWDQFDQYFGKARLGRIPSAAARMMMRRLARWDAATASRANRYVAISHYVASRIRRYYNRSADVVYPPVDTTFFHPDGRKPGRHFLIVSALVPYKRIDAAIEAARLAGVDLTIVGDGPDRRRLEAVAGPHVTFLGRRPDDEVRESYRSALALVLPGEEDFGIAPLEAQACGRPVVALARGGALETVVPNRTGVLVEEDTPAALAEGMRRLAAAAFDPAEIRAHAERFGRERFQREMKSLVDETLAADGAARW
ncbi:MAG TPA: glycosyltransferase [Vicinamibacterales bacterium]|nr:glycosyltransferase [Vicinamibacterales bacterium]